MTTAASPEPTPSLPESAQPGKKGLAQNAISFGEGLVIGLASTAPAYSLAAVLGSIVLALGVIAPSALLVAFVPMFFIAAAFYWLNRVDPDCGTTFSWVTRAMGPYLGWIGGWAVSLTGLLVIGSLADVGARYFFELIGWNFAADSKWAVMALAVVVILASTALTVAGTHLSARVQNVMIVVQITALLLFAVVAIVKVSGADAPEGSAAPAIGWFNPFAAPSFNEFVVSGLLVGVFVYWGWESCVNLTEETENSRTAAGLAAIFSTVILVVTYVATTIAVVGFLGPAATAKFEDEAILSTSATEVLGSPLDKLVILGVVFSAIASTQTTILPASRTLLSMARQNALPAGLGKVHPRLHTPHVSTIVVGGVATVWYVILNSALEDFLAQTLLALSLLIAFYYALSGFACVIYYRRELVKSAKQFVLIGVAPLLGAIVLGYVFVRAVLEFIVNPEDNSETGATWLGVAPPLVIGIGFGLLGVVLMLAWRAGGRGGFFDRKPETLSPELVATSALPSDAPTPPQAPPR
jgi:amino acid transporter